MILSSAFPPFWVGFPLICMQLLYMTLNSCGALHRPWSFLRVALSSPNSHPQTPVISISLDFQLYFLNPGRPMALPGIPFLSCGQLSPATQSAGAMPGGTYFASLLFEVIPFSFLDVQCLEILCSIYFVQFSDGKFLKFPFIHLSQK